jgi:hypothetical protein
MVLSIGGAGAPSWAVTLTLLPTSLSLKTRRFLLPTLLDDRIEVGAGDKNLEKLNNRLIVIASLEDFNDHQKSSELDTHYLYQIHPNLREM